MRDNLKKIFKNPFDKRILAYLFIIVFIILLYYPSLKFHFRTEDFALIEKVRDNFSCYHSFVKEFLESKFYRPVTRRLFFLVSYHLFGLNSAGYRFINLLLFCLNNIFLYEIVLNLTGKKDAAFIAAVFYLTRSAHLTPLYWITVGFQDNGVAFFVFLTIILFFQNKDQIKKVFYTASLLSSIFAFFSKEISVILPVLLIIIEIFTQRAKGYFNLKILIIKTLPFFLFDFLVYIPRIYLLRPLITDSPYKMQFSLIQFLKNLRYYVYHSFNNYPEILFLSFLILFILIFIFFNFENRRYVFLGISWFFVALLPQIFLAGHPQPYYLNISLAGFSIILPVAIECLFEKFNALKFLLIILLVAFWIISSRNSINNSEYIKSYYEYEEYINKILFDLKSKFPSFPDQSIIYIKDINPGIVWLLGYGSVISLNYDHTKLTVCFEGINERLPEKYSQIYYFRYDWDNHILKFIE